MKNHLGLSFLISRPFDMLEEANIHFHYEPGTAKRKHLLSKEKKHRYRRQLSNLVSNILNNIDWHANFTATIPFLIGSDEQGTTSSGQLQNDSFNANDSPTLDLHKSWGDRKLSITRRRKAKKVDDDFVLTVDRLHGDSQLAYTL